MNEEITLEIKCKEHDFEIVEEKEITKEGAWHRCKELTMRCQKCGELQTKWIEFPNIKNGR